MHEVENFAQTDTFGPDFLLEQVPNENSLRRHASIANTAYKSDVQQKVTLGAEHFSHHFVKISWLLSKLDECWHMSTF